MTWPSDNDLAMMRIGGRSVNDVSSMELYMFNRSNFSVKLTNSLSKIVNLESS